MPKARRVQTVKTSKKESSKRNENDSYLTPQPLADAICARLKKDVASTPGLIIEPSAGTGSFIRAARKVWGTDPEVHAIEINGRHRSQCESSGATRFHHGDWVETLQAWQPLGAVLVVGNPPFSLASEHIFASLEYLFPGSIVAFYLKMNFFGGAKREKHLWSQRQLKHVIPIIGRPSFKKTEKANNDTNEYGVFIWEVGYTGLATVGLPHIHWK